MPGSLVVRPGKGDLVLCGVDGSRGLRAGVLVVPGHPFCGRELGVVDASPGFTAVNRLGLARGVDASATALL